jgi:prepilin-type N-terminal cleavage/methylation domain-containing protein
LTPHAGHGFTLIELMVVIAIVAVLVGVAAPLTGSYLSRRQLEAAAYTMVQDLRRAQNEAIVTRTYIAVTFDTAANSYTFERTTGGPIVTRRLNSSTGFPSTVLGNSLAGTSVYLSASAQAPGGSQVSGSPAIAVLYFGPQGTPLTAPNLSATVAMGDGGGPVITLVSRGSLRVDVRVSPVVGLSSMEWK